MLILSALRSSNPWLLPTFSKADVPGRIAKPEFYAFWKEVLKAPESILRSLREGYSIPLKAFPPKAVFKHSATARDPENADFLDEY